MEQSDTLVCIGVHCDKTDLGRVEQACKVTAKPDRRLLSGARAKKGLRPKNLMGQSGVEALSVWRDSRSPVEAAHLPSQPVPE